MQDIGCLNVVIPAERYLDTLALYRDVLGLSVLHEGPRHCFLRAGGVNIAIHPIDRRDGKGATGDGIYLDFCIQNRQTAKATLSERGIPIEKEWEDSNGKFLRIRDPEGNVLELIEAP